MSEVSKIDGIIIQGIEFVKSLKAFIPKRKVKEQAAPRPEFVDSIPVYRGLRSPYPESRAIRDEILIGSGLVNMRTGTWAYSGSCAATGITGGYIWNSGDFPCTGDIGTNSTGPR